MRRQILAAVAAGRSQHVKVQAHVGGPRPFCAAASVAHDLPGTAGTASAVPSSPPPVAPPAPGSATSSSSKRPARPGAPDSAPGDVSAYNNVLYSWAGKASNPNANAGAKAEEWLQQMITSGVEPNEQSYNLVIKAYAKEGNAAAARRVTSDMSLRQLQPNVATYTTLLSAFAQKGDEEGTAQVLSDMRASDISPNYITYAVLIDAVAKKGDFVAAEAYLSELEEGPGVDRSKPEPSPYSTMMTHLARLGKAEAANDVWERMLSQEIKPDAQGYTVYIQLALNMGKQQDAEAMLSKMRTEGTRPNGVTMAAFLAKAAKEGNVVRCQELWQNIEEWHIKPTVSCYNSMIQVYAKTGMVDMAETWMKKLDTMPKSKGANEFTFGVLMDAYALASMPSKCQELFDSLKARGIRVNRVHHNTLIKAYTVSGDFDRAIELLRQMCGEDIQPDQYTFNPVVYGLIRAGSLDRADELTDFMGECGLEPDRRLTSSLERARRAQAEADSEAQASSADSSSSSVSAADTAEEFRGVDWVEAIQPDGSRWFRPVRGGGAAQPDPPSSGVVQLSSENGSYFWDVASNTTSWERPAA